MYIYIYVYVCICRSKYIYIYYHVIPSGNLLHFAIENGHVEIVDLPINGDFL